jgi:hypothetical protein
VAKKARNARPTAHLHRPVGDAVDWELPFSKRSGGVRFWFHEGAANGTLMV